MYTQLRIRFPETEGISPYQYSIPFLTGFTLTGSMPYSKIVEQSCKHSWVKDRFLPAEPDGEVYWCSKCGAKLVA